MTQNREEVLLSSGELFMKIKTQLLDKRDLAGVM